MDWEFQVFQISFSCRCPIPNIGVVSPMNAGLPEPDVADPPPQNVAALPPQNVAAPPPKNLVPPPLSECNSPSSEWSSSSSTLVFLLKDKSLQVITWGMV